MIESNRNRTSIVNYISRNDLELESKRHRINSTNFPQKNRNGIEKNIKNHQINNTNYYLLMSIEFKSKHYQIRLETNTCIEMESKHIE